MPEYDPLLTMTALNMAIVSLHRITSTRDRLILDREYKSIINNIRMGEINADTELTSLYQEIVRVIHSGRLRDDLRALIESSNVEDKRRSIGEIVADNALPSFDMNPLTWLGQLASSSISEYFRSEKENARREIYNEEKERRLRTDELNEYDELQRKLLDSSWKLLRQYSLPDSYRLTQNSLDKFYAAIQENDSSIRQRMLRYIEGDFSMYSPYWFYRAKAAYDSGEIEEAQKFFAKFNEVWRPVLRKDPYKVEALKYKIDMLVREGLSDENANMIRECLSEMRENAELEDWPNNIYMGMMYFTLGDKDAAIDSVMCNIDFGFESEISRDILHGWGVEIHKAHGESKQENLSVNLTPPTLLEDVQPETGQIEYKLLFSAAASFIYMFIWGVYIFGDWGIMTFTLALLKFLAVVSGLILGKKYGTVMCIFAVFLASSCEAALRDAGLSAMLASMFILTPIVVGTWLTAFISERNQPCLRTFIFAGLCGSLLFTVYAFVIVSLSSHIRDTDQKRILCVIPMDLLFSLTAALIKQFLQERKEMTQ